MNSNQPKTAEQDFEPWLERAKLRWRGATITGQGQFAVRLMDGKNIPLFETLSEAADFTSQDPVRKFTDLSIPYDPPPAKSLGYSNISSQSDWEDVLYERRKDRERAAAQQGTS